LTHLPRDMMSRLSLALSALCVSSTMAFTPPAVLPGRAVAKATLVCPMAPVAAPAQRARIVAIDDGMADAIFGIAFFTLFSSAGILFIKSTFYEAQEEGSILEDDPFAALERNLPFGAKRMTDSEAIARADEISTQLREAIAEREYPTALALKRELANLMVDYRIDYTADVDMPIGTSMGPDDRPPLSRPPSGGQEMSDGEPNQS